MPAFPKAIVLGDSGTGKTSLIMRHYHNQFRVPASTIGCCGVWTENSLNMPYDLWDTAGSERYQSMTPGYLRGSAVVVLTYDITRKDTLTNALTSWRKMVWMYTPEAHVILVGTKLDEAEDGKREVDRTEAAFQAGECGFQFFETSAKTGENVSQVFAAVGGIISRAGKHFELSDETVKLRARKPVPPAKSRKCCS